MRVSVSSVDVSQHTAAVLVPEQFARQVVATPHSLAVVDAAVRLTYVELDHRANRLAHHLISLGVGPEQLVAVGMPRSAELLVALLGVLKAGAAYLPVDLDNPPQRVAFMLGDARPALVVTTLADQHATTGGGTETPTVVLDHPATGCALATLPVTDPTDSDRVSPLLPESPAYVIYTSGSTGEPKGVVIEHRAMAAYLAFARAQYPSLRAQAVLHSSVAFDMTITTLFGPLLSGGSVAVCALADLTAAPGFLKVTPSHLALMPGLPDAATPTGDLVVGGEMLLGEVVEEFRRGHPDVRITNEYGPTEATVGCCSFVVEPGDTVAPGPVPVGRPTPATELYLLDDLLQPVAEGVEGELYIGGGQLARGYLNRPALTADRFMANPHGLPGSRMYRTGDRARWSASGDLVYLGRLDRQVKVHGHRIELGEIESALLRHPDLGRVAVTVYEQHIIGYVVAAPGGGLDAERLRRHASAVLPEYMVPSLFVELETLPLNANGKLEVGALPVPRFGATAPFRAARTATEKLLCELFSRYSGGGALVGVDDDFFALGGTSLGAAQVANQARRHGLRLSLNDVTTHRTPAKLAAGPGSR